MGCCDSSDHVLFGVIWSLRVWIKKEIEHFMCSLMDYNSKSIEDSGAECDLMNCGVLTQTFQRGRNLACCLEIILLIFW